MNNFRLSTNSTIKPFFSRIDEKYLNLPSVYNFTEDGQVINSLNGSLVRTPYVVEVISIDGSKYIFPDTVTCAKALNISRDTLKKRLNNFTPTSVATP